MSNPAAHVPVMLDRILDLLAPALGGPEPVVIDATLGLGGHAEAMLRTFDNLTVIGIDRDSEALRRSGERLAPFGARIRLVNAVYDEIPDVLAEAGLEQIDGALFDLGVSSMQLDLAERGFAYSHDAPLDMRMSQDDPVTAASIVNTYSAKDLARIFHEYGEERFASRVAKAIIAEREREPLNSTARLAELVRSAIPAATRRTGGHPAKRVFQALRIEVNRELAALSAALPAATSALKVGGRIVVLSYQSLEDRIVKQHFVSLAKDTTPLGLPVTLKDSGPELRLVIRGDAPTEDEVLANPRAASARLRVVERLRPSQQVSHSRRERW